MAEIYVTAQAFRLHIVLEVVMLSQDTLCPLVDGKRRISDQRHFDEILSAWTERKPLSDLSHACHAPQFRTWSR